MEKGAQTMERKELISQESQLVVKSNDLIQNSRFSLSAQEQKIILYIISKIKPTDKDLKKHTIALRDLCDLCGIEYHGQNYKNFKDSIQALANKSFWLLQADGKEILVRWLHEVELDTAKNAFTFSLNEYLKPYLLLLNENFTKYELTHILKMRSKYSIRLYEILKSKSHLGIYKISVDDLKKQLHTAEYSVYKDFRTRVIETAIEEINTLSDIIVNFEPIRESRKITTLKFFIEIKNTSERIDTYIEIEKRRKDNEK